MCSRKLALVFEALLRQTGMFLALAVISRTVMNSVYDYRQLEHKTEKVLSISF